MLRKAAVLIIGLVFLVSAAQANAPAVRINDISGWLLGSDGSTWFELGGKAVVANDNDGNVILTYRGTQPAEISRPAKAVIYNYANTGFLCGAEINGIKVETYNWIGVITPSGQAMLTCIYNPSSTP